MFNASVVKLVDTRDLKSLGRNAVPVRVRPLVPTCWNGVSPSGKAPGFDPGMRWFESSHPSHSILVRLSQGKKESQHFYWHVAQLVEPVTVNHLVVGSSPTMPAS